MTAQRRLILAELRRVRSHPTADQVYELVRRELPRISLGTVYRNLDVLARTGQVLRVGGDSVQMRFDGQTHAHCHVRCTQCSRVDDIEADPAVGVEEALRSKTDYRLTGHTIEFYGLCPACRNGCKKPDPDRRKDA